MPGPAQRSTALRLLWPRSSRSCHQAALAAAPTPSASRAEQGLRRTPRCSAERARLRAELDRLNAEIDRLKRSTRRQRRLPTARSDWPTRKALARRLTQVEAQLGMRAEPASAAKPLAEPTGRVRRRDGPTRPRCEGRHLGRSVARALTQQARCDRGSRPRPQDAAGAASPSGRPRSRSVRCHGRIEAACGQRRERRRLGARGRGGGGTTVAGPASSPSKNGDATTPTSGPSVSAGATPPTGSGPVGTTSLGAQRGLSGPSPTSTSGATTGTFGGATDAASPLALQLRDVLDTATLAEIRRLESRGPSGAAQALERAAAALRARAAELDSRGQQMRAQAHPAGFAAPSPTRTK